MKGPVKHNPKTWKKFLLFNLLVFVICTACCPNKTNPAPAVTVKEESKPEPKIKVKVGECYTSRDYYAKIVEVGEKSVLYKGSVNEVHKLKTSFTKIITTDYFLYKHIKIDCLGKLKDW